MLAEADISMTRMAMDATQEDRVFAQFYKHAKQNSTKTKEAGRPIYDEVDYVVIMVPGDKDNIVRRPVRGNDPQRFPKQWDQYQRGVTEQAQSGTPLEAWPMVTRAQVEELKFFGVHTIEALAGMPDQQAQNFMGIHKLKQAARDHIEAAKSEAPLHALRDENDALKAQMAAMQEQMAELAKQVNDDKPRRRTRKAAEE